MIPALRIEFNRRFTPERYASLLSLLERRCGTRVDYRVAETPVFVPLSLLNEMAAAGAELTHDLMSNSAYLAAVRQAIPVDYRVAGETAHPNFLTADFALVREDAGEPSGGPREKLVPRLVEIQAFPSVYGYQSVLCAAYRQAFGLSASLGNFLGGMREEEYLKLLTKKILGGHNPENVVLTELDPLNQKTRPDFEVTAHRLGIAVVDIRSLEAVDRKLYYRNQAGRRVVIDRIYNRAIADELMARHIRLPFDLTQAWDVEWAGHPNWYFLISKFSIPWFAVQAKGPRSRPPVTEWCLRPCSGAIFLRGRGARRCNPRVCPCRCRRGQIPYMASCCSSRSSHLRAKESSLSLPRRNWKQFRRRGEGNSCFSSGCALCRRSRRRTD